MKDFTFHPSLMVRRPALHPEDFTEEKLKAQLKQDFFRSAIWLASISLYNEMEKYGFDYDLLPPRIRASLNRYFNRMCFRATPFGLFSSFSCSAWRADGAVIAQASNEGNVHLLPDFRCLVLLAENLTRAGLPQLLYRPNTSLYKTGRYGRFISPCNIGQKNFEVRSFKYDSLLGKLLKFCSAGRSFAELTTFLSGFNFSEEEARGWLQEIISSGLLLSGLLPNITGELYLNRLRRMMGSEGYNTLNHFILEAGDPYLKPECLAEIAMPLPENESGSPFYAVFEKQSSKQPEMHWQGKLLQGLHALDLLSAAVTSPDLELFKNRFLQRFDRQEIQLLKALDPETGAGYGFESGLSKSLLTAGLQFSSERGSAAVSWSAANKLLLKIISSTPSGNTVVLRDDELETLEKSAGTEYPPSCPVVFRLAGDKVLIESSGAASAHALTGRFTLLNKNLLDSAKEIAAQEALLNPDVVFAEVAFYTNDPAANINARHSVYEYEIPVLTHSVLPADKQIELCDLYVSVRNNRVILRSRKLNRIVVPRMSSAFNHYGAGLSVFRFLCDLQYQGLKASFGLQLPALFPGLSFYPRIEYKSCVLTPATWVLSLQQLKRILDAEINDEVFNDIAAEIRLPRFFTIGVADRQLTVDRNCSWSLKLFFSGIGFKKPLVLTEVLVCPEDDSEGKHPFYTEQYIASLVRKTRTYQPLSKPDVFPVNPSLQRNFLPAENWICFKIYCHPDSADAILVKLIRPLLKRFRRRKLIQTWFFIRYTDPDHHIRLRFRFIEGKLEEISSTLNKRLKELFDAGIIQNVSIVPYERELERYGHRTIEEAEKVFEAGSEMALECLAYRPAAKNEHFLVQCALISAVEALTLFFDDSAIEFLHSSFTALFREFGGGRELKKGMDLRYRKLSFLFSGCHLKRGNLTAAAGEKKIRVWVTSLKLLRLNSMKLNASDAETLCADMLHMHFNRMFSREQKKQEMMVYFMFWKYMRGKRSVAHTKESL